MGDESNITYTTLASTRIYDLQYIIAINTATNTNAMNKDEFEYLIKDYAEKIVDKDNPAIKTFKVKLKSKSYLRRVISAKNADICHAATNHYENSGKKVKTPDGVFISIKAAARRYEITYETARQRCMKQKEGWSFYEE